MLRRPLDFEVVVVVVGSPQAPEDDSQQVEVESQKKKVRPRMT